MISESSCLTCGGSPALSVRGHDSQAADDLVQEAIVLAMRTDSPKRGPALVSWCFGSLIRFNRLRQRQGAAGVPSAEPGGSGAPLPFLPKEILRLDALSLDHREVCFSRFWPA